MSKATLGADGPPFVEDRGYHSHFSGMASEQQKGLVVPLAKSSP